MKLGTGSIRADLVGKVMPGHQTTVEGLAKMFPSLLEMQTDVSFNKQVVKTIMNNYMNAAGKSMSESGVGTDTQCDAKQSANST